MTTNLDTQAACEAIELWSKRLTDHKFNPAHSLDRIKTQQQLLQPLLGTSKKAADGIATSITSASPINKELLLNVVAQAPILDQPISADEIDHPQWSTDIEIWQGALQNRSLPLVLASDWRYWHLITLQQILNAKVPEGSWLLAEGGTNQMPLKREDLNTPASQVRQDQAQTKRIDNTVRNVLRRSGGIWLRRHQFRLDAPLALAWWRVMLAEAAAQVTEELEAQDIYEIVFRRQNDKTGHRSWFELATRSSTRLAAPSALAAVALAKQREPKADLKILTTTLLRRTSNISVHHVSANVLAEMLVEDVPSDTT